MLQKKSFSWKQVNIKTVKLLLPKILVYYSISLPLIFIKHRNSMNWNTHIHTELLFPFLTWAHTLGSRIKIFALWIYVQNLESSLCCFQPRTPTNLFIYCFTTSSLLHCHMVHNYMTHVLQKLSLTVTKLLVGLPFCLFFSTTLVYRILIRNNFSQSSFCF